MNTDDRTAVRDLADELTFGSNVPNREPSLARTWNKIITMERRRPARRRWVPVVAAFATVLTVVGGAWLAAPSQGPEPVQPQVMPAAPVDGESIDIDEAWSQLMTAAETANAVPIGPGSIIYVAWVGGGLLVNETTRTYPYNPSIRQAWFDPNGFMLREMRGGIAVTDTSIAGPPGLAFPTPQWIATLPTDRAALSALLLDEADRWGHTWSQRFRVWEMLTHLLSIGDLLLPRDVRTATYAVLATEPGLTARTVTFDGRVLYAIGRTEGVQRQEILFDPGTGRTVGRRSLYLADDPSMPADKVTGWSVWREQSIVNAVGAMPTP